MPQVWRCQKSTLGPLELESQLVVSFLTWMLRYELGPLEEWQGLLII